MARAELGTKRTDPETGKKFYDFGKDPIVSPYTGVSYALAYFEPPAVPSKYGRSQPRPVLREEPAADATEAEPLADDDDEAETVSLSDVEEEEDVAAKRSVVDSDEEDDDGPEDEDDAVFALDEENDDDVEDIVGDTRDDDD